MNNSAVNVINEQLARIGWAVRQKRGENRIKNEGYSTRGNVSNKFVER